MTLTSEDSETTGDSMDLDARLLESFAGKVVRKDLTKRLKEGANVPVYVLEYLLGKYQVSFYSDPVDAAFKAVGGGGGWGPTNRSNLVGAFKHHLRSAAKRGEVCGVIRHGRRPAK